MLTRFLLSKFLLLTPILGWPEMLKSAGLCNINFYVLHEGLCKQLPATYGNIVELSTCISLSFSPQFKSFQQQFEQASYFFDGYLNLFIFFFFFAIVTTYLAVVQRGMKAIKNNS